MSARYTLLIDGSFCPIQQNGKPYVYATKADAEAWAQLGNSHDPADNSEAGHTYEAIQFDEEEPG